MRLRIVEHYSQENGRFLYYELQYKPCWWWPVWRCFTSDSTCTKDRNELNQNIAFAFMLDGTLTSKREYD